MLSDKIADWWPFVTKRTMDRYIEQANDDYQHTHDVLWKILNLLCEEFGLHLTVTKAECDGWRDQEEGD